MRSGFSLIILVLGFLPTTISFTTPGRRPPIRTELLAIKVPASELESRLTSSEKTNVRVARQAGPSVAFVTSIWPRSNNTRTTLDEATVATKNNLPPGQNLGSGSAFVVDAEGYLVTNYHVIQQAYELQALQGMVHSVSSQIAGNISQVTGFNVSNAFRRFVEASFSIRPAAKVFVRLNSETQYQLCSIVDVKPELDLAVLKVDAAAKNQASFEPMKFGASSDLLVGQGLIAIGNPFGLDKTVTTGVVSALNREIRTPSNNGIMNQPIRNCIQTDCYINFGNSGGPLLNFQGEVVGVNTAIIATSGSYSGIGFAVPSDAVKPAMERIIRHDRIKKKKSPWLGVEILQVKVGANITQGTPSKLANMNWIGRIARDSPADKADIKSCFLDPVTAGFKYGEAIVAVNGRPVPTYGELQSCLEDCVVGEKLSVTLEDENGDRRVVYLTLTERPSSEA